MVEAVMMVDAGGSLYARARRRRADWRMAALARVSRREPERRVA